MPDTKKKVLSVLRFSLVVFFVISFSLLVISFDTIKDILNSLAEDGNVESFQISQFKLLKIISLILFLFTLSALYFTIFHPHKTIASLNNLGQYTIIFIQRYKKDISRYIWIIHRDLPSKKEGWFIGFILSIAAFLRFRLLTRPIEYDEAYTYNEFARHSLEYITSEYYVVNNHIFQTILVKLSTSIFGPQPWAIRLPVYIAGILLVYACYQFSKKIFNNVSIATISAVLITFLPILIDKSVSARAYMLIALFFITTLNISLYVLEERNLFAWTLIGVVISLGVFSNPIMLYPFSILFMWFTILGLANLFKQSYKNKIHWFKYVFITAGFAGLLSILFYSQIFKHYGLFSVFNGNQVVDPLPYSAFVNQFPAFLFSIYEEWKTGISKILFINVFSFYFISLFFIRSEKKETKILFFLFPILTVVLIFIQKPTIIARIWLWMIPLLLIGSSAGIYKLFVANKSKFYRIPMGAILLSFILLLAFSAVRFVYPIPYEREENTSIPITEYLQSQLTDDDIVVASIYMDAKYWYYFNLLELPETSIRGIKQRPFSRAFTIVYPNNYENLDQVLSEFGPDKVFLDRSTDKLVFEYKNVFVYEIQANEIAILDQFK